MSTSPKVEATEVSKVEEKGQRDSFKEADEKAPYIDVTSEDPEHVEGAALSQSYLKKVYIINRVMNEHVGFSRWHWGLMLLSGYGWLVDNLWLQGVAIILPQVNREFAPQHVEWMTFALYIGLILGAAGWGVAADIIGRRPAFNITLFLAGVFGIAAGGARNEVALGGLLAALGVGLGGNLPVDGMLFLEFIPGSKQYLLTLLSVFWSIGQLIASLVAWVFIVNYTCSGDNSDIATSGVCISSENQGWRYTFYTLGAVTLAGWFLRFVVFQLPESPKYLLSQGRDAEAVQVVKEIARRSGKELGDDILSVALLRSAAGEAHEMSDADEIVPEKRGLAGLLAVPKQLFAAAKNFSPSHLKPDLKLVKPLFATPKLAYNTSIIFVLWSFIGLAYPLFNAFLPLYLESRSVGTGNASVNETYSQYAYISICGVPGSLIAAWMVEMPRSGRRGAMALGTLLTGIFVIVSTQSPNKGAFLTFLCLEALFQNIMYGVLYAYTPESFPSPVRGTGDGIASSLNRIFGLMSPIIRIYGASESGPGVNAPLFTSGAMFIFCGLLMLTLRVESQGRTAL
ncbi:MFS general substrate transporter [Ceraceosorus guamensis]|uniref:MFS general substrate transporter n=1 Tax=Ceraceosorus guamensis TaxID=1522189 RepID=A0A316W4V7_9BASI|nr:MFS general substrate transporter [Ceraceosorus guamensis]PWN43691.1 MFS general substrate transporter [Ceraceosorus guamensis]